MKERKSYKNLGNSYLCGPVTWNKILLESKNRKDRKILPVTWSPGPLKTQITR
jgi:hypothetical protein